MHARATLCGGDVSDFLCAEFDLHASVGLTAENQDTLSEHKKRLCVHAQVRESFHLHSISLSLYSLHRRETQRGAYLNFVERRCFLLLLLLLCPPDPFCGRNACRCIRSKRFMR